MTWENRIIGTGTEAPDQLLANPMNWRIHPRNQQQAIGAVLSEVGWVQNIIVNQRTGHVVDGHMRVAVAISNEAPEVPVVYVDLDEHEEKLILASLDPIGSMAVTDSEMMSELLSDLQGQGGVDDLLAELTEKYKPADTMIDTGAPRRPLYSDEEITQAAFEYFREHGFPYRNVPKFIAMQTMNHMAMMDDPPRRHTSSGTDIADTHHPQRWHASADGGNTPVEAFNNDKTFLKALNLHHKWGVAITAGYPSILNLTNATKTVFNFRSGLASYFYRKYCPDGGTVLDCSAGYGGRLIGAMVSSVVKHYIGIDPDTKSHAGNTKILDTYAPEYFSGTLINMPAEEVDMEPYAGTVDFALTSPPYFTKEHYSDEPTQSMHKFPEPDAWRQGFLHPLLAQQYGALKPGAINAINITDVNVKEGHLPLVEWAKEAALAAGFEFAGTENVPYAKRPVPSLADKNLVEAEPTPVEDLLLFRKPE